MELSVTSNPFWTNYLDSSRSKAIKQIQVPISSNQGFQDNSIHIYHAPPASENRDDSYAAVKWVGTIVAALGAAVLGFLVKDAYDTYTESKEIQQLSSKLDDVELIDTLKTDLKEHLSIENSACRLLATKVGSYALCAFAVMTSAAILAAGGFAALPTLVIPGATLLTLSAIATAITMHLHSNDSSKLKDQYNRLVFSATTLLNKLASQPEDLQLATAGSGLLAGEEPKDLPPAYEIATQSH